MTGTAQIITFSGIDGAGKTTQIELASWHLQNKGCRIVRAALWDDVAVFPQLRTDVSARVISTPPDLSQPLSLRNDKNVHAWYLTLIRAMFYLLDTLRLRLVVRKLRASSVDFIIFDRYVYDLLVQIRPRHWFARLYNRALVALAPTPRVAFILDASPDEAFRRKPEYPLEFMHEYRRAFLRLREFVPQLTVIPHGTIEEVQHRVLESLLSSAQQSTNPNDAGHDPAPYFPVDRGKQNT
jgi:thymidylate kinase